MKNIILPEKLENTGISGIALKWFESYLKDRRQYETTNDTQGNKMKVTCGVPQDHKDEF